jgi:hypothetical protein
MDGPARPVPLRTLKAPPILAAEAEAEAEAHLCMPRHSYHGPLCLCSTTKGGICI